MNAKIQKIIDIIRTFLKNTGDKIQDTHPFIQIVSFLVCAGIVCILFFTVIFNHGTRRSVFFYPDSRTNALCTEIRYLPVVHGKDASLELYVSEVLLGSADPDRKLLFNRDTTVLSCFIRKNTAYIDLSAAAAYPEGGITASINATEIFKKNVCTNFRYVDKIYLYFEGIEVYKDNLVADANQKNKKR